MNTIKDYTATVQHHSIAKHYQISFKASSVKIAKSKAMKEFGKGYIGHKIVLVCDNDLDLRFEKVIGSKRWSNSKDI